MQFRKGDIVSVQGTVKYPSDGDDRIFIEVDGNAVDLWLKPGMLTLVRAKFDVGDRVCWTAPHPAVPGKVIIGEIIGISGDHAWIDLEDGNYCTRHFGAIDRIPDVPESAHDAA